MGEPRGILGDETLTFSAKDRAEKRSVVSARNQFDSYKTNKWEHTYFNGNTGGYVVTEFARIPQNPERNMSNEGKKYRKERSMCIDLANFGLRVKHLSENPGISSADVNIVKGNHSIIEINGKTADLKDLNNSNNIRREARDTFEIKKKADVIAFRFHEKDKRSVNKIVNEIKKRQEKGEHGYYYFAGENKLYEF